MRGDTRVGQLGRVIPGLLAAALMTLPALPASAATAPSTPSTRIGVGQPRTVNPRKLPKAKPGTHPRVKIPFLTRNAAAYRAAKSRARSASTLPRAAPPNTAANPPVVGLFQSTGFAGSGMEEQVAALGADQGLEPPDTQLAAGPDTVVETTNSAMSIWSKAGARIWDPPTGIVDLNEFFPQIDPGYSFTDPSILYDSGSQRFFLTGLAIDASLRSKLLAAVSVGSDPLGTWITYDVTPIVSSPGHLLDQPKLGTSDDKVVLAYDDFQGCGDPATCHFVEDGVIILPKLVMMAGGSLQGKETLQAFSSSFGILPVRSLSSTSTVYLVENENLDDPAIAANAIGLRTVTGDPNAPATIAVSAPTSLGLSRPWLQPPNAPQPVTDAMLQTGDGRIDSATWRNGVLWAGLADGCFPTATNPPQPTGSCLLWIRVTTVLCCRCIAPCDP